MYDPLTNTVFRGSTVLFDETSFGLPRFWATCTDWGIDSSQKPDLDEVPETIDEVLELNDVSEALSSIDDVLQP